MKRKTFKLGEDTVTLPRGTRVLLKIDLRGDDGFVHRASTAAIVREVFHNTYFIETPSGRRLKAERDQIQMAREDLLAQLGKRQLDFGRLRETVMYEAVVGSRAWGLADESSDEDVRGWFLLPFEDFVSLWHAPDEIQSSDSDAAYWEIEKLLYQALRADANTLECLWSPLHRKVTPLGESLLAIRSSFISMNVLGSFGRYAESQFRKIERSELRNTAIAELLEAIERKGLSRTESAEIFLLERGVAKTAGRAREEVKAVYRSLFDRGLLPESTFESLVLEVVEGRRKSLEPTPHRPKNAYNLLRLLHSCLHCLRTGEPLIRVEGELKQTLLAIKSQQMSLEKILALARELAREIDEEAKASTLPEKPDFEAADAFLKRCRRHAARRTLGLGSISVVNAISENDDYRPTVLPVDLPRDVVGEALQRFLARYISPESPEMIPLLWLTLSGAHAYGFPSDDSDLDLKGAHTMPARTLLGLGEALASIDLLCDWEGRELDFTSNELGQVARLLLKGNGNMFERFLGPYPIVTTPAGHRLRALARDALSQRVHHHYAGFLRGMEREYRREAAEGIRKAKRLLYGYRVALTGIHVLRTGEVVTSVLDLYDQYGFPNVPELVELKHARETATIDEADEPRYLEDLERLEAVLHNAATVSVLPEEPPNRDNLESYVIEERLRL